MLGMLLCPFSSGITFTCPLPGRNTPTEQYVVPRSIPITFGVGIGKYCWARYPASKRVKIAEPKRKKKKKRMGWVGKE